MRPVRPSAPSIHVAPLHAGVRRAGAWLLLVAALGMAATGLPVLAADGAAPLHVHARCIPWRGVALAVGCGALAGWALMRLGRIGSPKPSESPQPPDPRGPGAG